MADINKNKKQEKTARLYNLYVETAHLVLKYDDRVMKSSILTAAKFKAMMILESAGGTMISSKLAEQTGTRPHNITKIVQGMKRDGLVTTKKNDGDMRFVFITLTDKGHSVLDQARPSASEIAQRIMDNFSVSDLNNLERLLNVLKKNTIGNSVK